ncbi:putative tetratricopeptide-like helical domain superfamily [Helianthus anomalus]
MTLNLTSPWPNRLHLHSTHHHRFNETASNSQLFYSFRIPNYKNNNIKASLSESYHEGAVADGDDDDAGSKDYELIVSKVSAAKDASEALQVFGEMSKRSGGVVSTSDCCEIISAALDRNNAELALSVFQAMRSSFDAGDKDVGDRWRWSRPDVNTYTLLVRGLAASLRVSDALKIIANVCRVGVSPGEEVPFGKIVKCPSCMIAVAVAQPQNGIQIVSCSKCRYQYELVSGNITSIESEEISMDVPAWKRGLQFLQLIKESTPAAVHSIVVQTPSGTARTHRFATKTLDLPAQEGERVTIASAAPSSVYREVGPLKFSPKTPNYYPGEPMFLTNHLNGRESPLIRAPAKNGGLSLFSPTVFFPLLAVFGSGDVASGMIDPSLPQIISVAAVSSVAVGATLNGLVLPQFNRLPPRVVETVAIRQQLLSQYDTLQSRIKELKEAAENEVWMLARMCQLENKIVAVGEPSYRARRSRVKKVREGLENSLKSRIELIESYARISSMIEIEVEMDSDVLAAESASNAETIAEQIEQIMEIENLEERWRIRAEANDEVEKLLNSEILPSQQVSDI